MQRRLVRDVGAAQQTANGQEYCRRHFETATVTNTLTEWTKSYDLGEYNDFNWQKQKREVVLLKI